jgi:hypothetical protein
MLSRPPLKNIATIGMIMQLEPFTHEILSEYYEGDEDFRKVYKQLKERIVVFMEGNEYHIQDGLLYKLGKLCIPRDKRVQLMREAHTSRVVGNFGMTKTVVNLQRYVYWPKM